MKKLIEKLNNIIEKYDFGYDLELKDHGEWSIKEDDGVYIAGCVCYFELIEDSSSLSHGGHFFVKLNKENLEVINQKFNLDVIDD